MGDFIQTTALTPFADIPEAKATEMIADAEAQAILAAPCIPGLLDVPPDESAADRAIREAKLAAIKSILRAAILRWNEAGMGVTQTVRAGEFSQTQQFQGRRSMFWPTEIESLQKVCAEEKGGMVSVAISSGRSGGYRTAI